MTKAVIIRGDDYPFGTYASTLHEAMDAAEGLSANLVPDAKILASRELQEYDVLVYGDKLSRRTVGEDGKITFPPFLEPAEEQGLLDFVRGGKGLCGLHYMSWSLPGHLNLLVGGSANWHPPIKEHHVIIEDPDHEITKGIGNFSLHDELYMLSWDVNVHVLAIVEWYEKRLPVAWTHQYGDGRVFYTSLGHDERAFATPEYLQLLISGAKWAAGR